jgi:hypothetical protein
MRMDGAGFRGAACAQVSGGRREVRLKRKVPKKERLTGLRDNLFIACSSSVHAGLSLFERRAGGCGGCKRRAGLLQQLSTVRR